MTIEVILVVLYAGVLLVWITRHPCLTIGVRTMHRLTRQSPQDLPDPAPLVSVLIPAHDEEESIKRCVESILAGTYPNLEILVADDRSGDRTAEIVAELAERDSRVRLIHITNLPEGWTGKTNALWRATHEAKGEYLLFVDADTVQEPENLAVCLHRMLTENADMLSLLPRMRNETFWENVVQPLASVCLMIWFPLDKVNDPKSKKAFGNGQYILMNRRAYEAIGGHRGVRSALLEDIALARTIKRNGHRLLVCSATEISSTRMYTSIDGMIKGWGRIYYAAADRRLIRIVRGMLIMVAFSITAYVIFGFSLAAVLGGATNWFAWTIFGMSIAHIVVKYSVIGRLYLLGGNSLRYLPFYLLAACIVHLAQWSAIRKVFSRQVTWRGTAYGQAPRT